MLDVKQAMELSYYGLDTSQDWYDRDLKFGNNDVTVEVKLKDKSNKNAGMKFTVITWIKRPYGFIKFSRRTYVGEGISKDKFLPWLHMAITNAVKYADGMLKGKTWDGGFTKFNINPDMQVIMHMEETRNKNRQRKRIEYVQVIYGDQSATASFSTGRRFEDNLSTLKKVMTVKGMPLPGEAA